MVQAVTQTFTGAQADAVLFAASARQRVIVHGIVFAAHADNSVSPLMRVKLGGQTIVEHPGVPAGGGLSMSGFAFSAGQDDDITFDCGAPTGGSVSVMVAYSVR